MNLCQYVQVLFRCTQEIDSQNYSHNLFDNFNQKHLDLSILQFCWHYFLPKCFIAERSILYDQSSSTTNEMSPSWRLQHPKHVTNPYGPLKNFMIIFCWSRSCRVQTVVYYELPEPNRRKYSEIVQASFREMIILFFHFLSFGCSLSESSSGNSFACSFFSM